jgi:hypothetical protein
MTNIESFNFFWTARSRITFRGNCDKRCCLLFNTVLQYMDFVEEEINTEKAVQQNDVTYLSDIFVELN